MDLSKLTKQAVKTTNTSAKVNVKTGGMSIKTGVKAGPLGVYMIGGGTYLGAVYYNKLP